MSQKGDGLYVYLLFQHLTLVQRSLAEANTYDKSLILQWKGLVTISRTNIRFKWGLWETFVFKLISIPIQKVIVHNCNFDVIVWGVCMFYQQWRRRPTLEGRVQWWSVRRTHWEGSPVFIPLVQNHQPHYSDMMRALWLLVAIGLLLEMASGASVSVFCIIMIIVIHANVHIQHAIFVLRFSFTLNFNLGL